MGSHTENPGEIQVENFPFHEVKWKKVKVKTFLLEVVLSEWPEETFLNVYVLHLWKSGSVLCVMLSVKLQKF